MNIYTDFDWKIFSWVRRGSRRTKVLKYLYEVKQPLTATEVKKHQKIDITQAAFTLTELWQKGLVDCLNPDDHHGKLFVITKKGKDIIKKLVK